MEQHYVTQAAVSSDSLLLKKARPQGELLSLWFPEGPGENGKMGREGIKIGGSRTIADLQYLVV